MGVFMTRLLAKWGFTAAGILLSTVWLGGNLLVAAPGGEWETWLRFSNGSLFGINDPVFEQDIGFYVFRWPFLQFVNGWGLWLVGLAFVGSALVHFGDQLRDGRIQLRQNTLMHLTLLAAVFLGLKSWGFYLQRYEVLYSAHGALYGAGYTDLHVRLPAYNVLAIIMGAAAIILPTLKWWLGS